MEDSTKLSKLGWISTSRTGQADIAAFGQMLSAEECKELKGKIKSIASLNSFYGDYIAIESNYEEVIRSRSMALDDFRKQPNVVVYDGFRAFFYMSEIQRCLTNFLASASAFRDRAKMKVSRSDWPYITANDFQAILAAEYDDKFSYRLLYNLRNYTQHQNAPLSVIPMKAKRNGEEFVFDIELSIKSKNLRESKLIQSGFRAELTNKETEKFDLVPLCKEHVVSSRNILTKILNPSKGDIQSMIDFITRMRKESKNENDDAILVIIDGEGSTDNEGKKIGLSLSHFPEKAVREFSLLID